MEYESIASIRQRYHNRLMSGYTAYCETVKIENNHSLLKINKIRKIVACVAKMKNKIISNEK